MPLHSVFQEMGTALIAYSGGVDSTLVAKVAFDVLGDTQIAITAVSPSLLPEELDEAQPQAQIIGIKHELIETEEMNNPNYTSNPVNRCYFCKSELHDKLRPHAMKEAILTLSMALMLMIYRIIVPVFRRQRKKVCDLL